MKKIIISAMMALFLIGCASAADPPPEEIPAWMKKELEGIKKSIKEGRENLDPNAKRPPIKKGKTAPKADPNKVYNVDVGDSFSEGPKDAKVTIIEWMDFQ